MEGTFRPDALARSWLGVVRRLERLSIGSPRLAGRGDPRLERHDEDDGRRIGRSEGRETTKAPLAAAFVVVADDDVLTTPGRRDV